MEIELKKVKLSEIQPNPDNPRQISKPDMDRLLKSLQEFPEMLKIREIVTDENMVILGGNMRYQALKAQKVKDCEIKDLDYKIELAKNNIFEWYEYFQGKVYVAYSGGKDSSVLLHLVRGMYPEVPAVYYKTGLEWPEIEKMVNKTENVVKIRPRIPFSQKIQVLASSAF